MDFRDRIVRLDRVPASQIENAPWNYRKHPESQVSALRGSVEELGFFKPLDVYVTDEGMYRLIDGEARRNLIEADVSPDQLIPISVTDLSESEAKKALLIADPLSQLAETDSAALESLMRDVQIADEALAAMVAGMAEEAGIIPPEEATGGDTPDPEPQLDRAEELQRQWQTSPGQLWEIVGKSGMVHRLLCGDSTNVDDVARLMNGEQSPLLVTSPPYWVGKEYEREKTWDEVQTFIANCVVAWAPFLTHRVVINTGAPQAAHLTGLRAHIRLLLDDWAREFSKAGLLLRYTRIWTKTGGLCHTRPESDCVDQHWEFIAMFYRPETFEGQRRLGEPWATNGIWDDIPQVAQAEHSAPFHIELPSRNIRLHTDEGALIFEPFCGSGTTMIAADNLGRRCFGIEIGPSYTAVILQRCLDAGMQPRLLSPV